MKACRLAVVLPLASAVAGAQAPMPAGVRLDQNEAPAIGRVKEVVAQPRDIYSREVLDEVRELASLMDAYFLSLEDARALLERAIRRALDEGRSVIPLQLVRDLVAQSGAPPRRERVLRELLPASRTPIGEPPDRLTVALSDETLFGQLREEGVINRYWKLRVVKGLTPAEYVFASGSLLAYLNGGTLVGGPFAYLQRPGIKLDLFLRASPPERKATIERLERPIADGPAPAFGPARELADTVKILRRIDLMLR